MKAYAHESLAGGFAFCEAPRVDDRGNAYFSDLTGGGYHVVRENGVVETVLAGRRYIGGAVLDDSGALLVSGEGGIIALDPATGLIRPVLNLIEGQPIIAVNDIEADAAGGVYGGTIDFPAIFERGETPKDGIFFRLDTSGAVEILRRDVVASNGIGFSPDGGTLYHSESTVGVWAWPIAHGHPTGPPRLLITLDDCDGLVVDGEGALWVAFWHEGALRRYLPDGRCVGEHRLTGVPHIVGACWGSDRHWLYLTTGASEACPLAGGLVRIRVDWPGLPAFKARITPPLREIPSHGS